MFDISFEINGREVNPNDMEDALESAILSQVAEFVKESVGNLRCAEHEQSPKIKVKGSNLDNLSFDISGCCNDLIEKVRAKFE